MKRIVCLFVLMLTSVLWASNAHNLDLVPDQHFIDTAIRSGLTVSDLGFIGDGMTVDNVIYVDAATGEDTGGRTGKDPKVPFATWGYAYGKANVGDTIVFFPGHTENYCATPTVVGASAPPHLDRLGIKCKSLGIGDNRATFNFVTATLTSQSQQISITAGNNWLENLRFVANVGMLQSAIYVASDCATIVNCEFVDALASATENWIFVDEGADNARFLGLTYFSSASMTNHPVKLCTPTSFIGVSATKGGLVENLQIAGCRISGRFGQAPIWAANGSITDCLISNNYLSVSDTGYGIKLDIGGSTGLARENSIMISSPINNFVKGTGCIIALSDNTGSTVSTPSGSLMHNASMTW